MFAAILAVGSELLGTDRLDTNSLTLTEMLRSYGWEVRRKVVVRDVEGEIADELARLVATFDLVIATGGLGPTSDDLTREAAARALGRPLRRDTNLEAEIERRFQRWSGSMPASNARQADVIEGAAVLSNPRGTAPGLKIDHGASTLFLFPGVPSELEYLMRSALVPWLAAHSDGLQVETRILKVACVSESALEDLLAPFFREFDAAEVSILAAPGDIQVRFTVAGDASQRQQKLAAMTERVRDLVGPSLYGIGLECTLEQTVGGLLTESRRTVVTAESCTAGLTAERLTRVAGSSTYFRGGVVTYSNELKQQLLGVSSESLEAHGAVSREVVVEMATGATRRLGGDLGVAISGIAGPGGGTDDKPVGTVHIGIAWRHHETWHRKLHLPGDRERIRWLASQWALDLLRRRLLAGGRADPADGVEST